MNERSIFAAALDIADAAERAQYLDRACGNDAALRRQVDRLLVAQGELGSFLDQPPPGIAQAITEQPITEKPGAMIGPYKLLEQIGEGGMGLVFHADQLRPVRRRVALKIIKPGMDTKQVIARFEAERQALALMDHPNIARVLDAGATDSGRPYFVMELVRGIPITEYCDHHKLTIRQRLELFMRVCNAVQHAHQKGIIHRDLKPTNVLVAHDDTVPVPKVIDFGVAKATGQSLTERSLFTGIAQMLGTPRYMSPEQASLNLLDVDTRSDIYSLGVLLYELLTGTTPFEEARMKTLGLDEMRRIIQEEEPPHPSTRVSTLGATLTTTAERRSVDPRRMSVELRGDLDWIVMKALDKDRNRRYETANSFALDVGRYLANEPVEACPPSVGYRMRKFARRNRGALATAALFAVMLLGTVGAVAGIAGAWINDRETRESAAARAIEEDLREVDLLQEQERWPEMLQVLERARSRLVIAGSTPLRERVEQRGKDLTMIEQLEAARFHLLPARGKPLDQEEVDWALPLDHELDQKAADLAYRTAFARYGIDLDSDPAKAAERIRASAIHTQLVSALDEWADIKDLVAAGSGDALSSIAQLADKDRWRQELRNPNVRNNREKLKRLAKAEDVLAQPPANLIVLCDALDRAKERVAAVALLRRAQRRHPANFWINYYLGAHLARADSTKAAALGYLRVAQTLRPKSPGVLIKLAQTLRLQETFPEDSGVYYPEAIEVLQKAIALEPNFVTYILLSDVCWRQEKWQEAEAYANKAIALNENHSLGYCCLGVALRRQGKLADARDALEKAIQLNSGFYVAYHNLGGVLRRLGKNQDAVKAYDQAIILDGKFAPSYFSRGIALDAQNDLLKAEDSFRKGLKFQGDFDDANINVRFDKGNFFSAYIYLAGILARQEKPVEAEMAARKALQLMPDNAQAHFFLARALHGQGRFAEALAALGRANEIDSCNARQSPSIKQWIGEVERDVKSDAKLLRLMKVETKGVNAAECIELARSCERKRLYFTSVRFYQEAFLGNPELADNFKTRHRFRAALAAALALGSENQGGGKVTAADRTAVRKQAYDWLKANLGYLTKQFQGRQLGAALVLSDEIREWQRHPNLAAVREKENLANLPKAEQGAWQKLWADVEQLRKQADGMFMETIRLPGTVGGQDRQPLHKVKLKAGRSYVIDLECTALVASLRLLDAEGQKLDGNDGIDDFNRNSRLIFTPKTSGVYRLAASAYENDGDWPYTVTIREFVK